MVQVSGVSAYQPLQAAIKSSLSDRNLDKNELSQLKQYIADAPGLSAEAKQGLVDFLEQAHQDSKGFFFGLFGKGISDRELNKLNQFISESGNPLLQGLLDELQSTQSQQTQRSSSQAQTYPSAGFEPAGFQFPTTPATQAPLPEGLDFPEADEDAEPLNFQPGNLGGEGFDANISDFYVTQNGNGLASGGGDCGPACAAMVMKGFGLMDPNTSSREAIQLMRQGAGVTSPRNGAWAITEAEMANSIEKMSGGRVRQTGKEKFSGGQVTQFLSHLQGQLADGAMPVIEVGSPYGGKGRHYMIATEVKPNGNIVVADPGGKGQWEITPAKLQELMNKADNRGGSHIMSFKKVA